MRVNTCVRRFPCSYYCFLSSSLLLIQIVNSDMEDCNKSFEEGWPLLQTAVKRVINQLEGADNSSFTTEDYMSYYTTVYDLCTGRRLGPGNSKLLYDHYKMVIEEYINSKVLPSFQGKKDELLLQELLRRWSNHKIMTRSLSRFFHYLDRYDLPRLGHPSLEETSFLLFYDLVYDEINKQVVDAMLSMIDQERAGEQIDQERAGEQIDRSLVNNTLAIYSEIGDGPRKNHAKVFEDALCCVGASNWIASSSFQDNTPKEEELHDSPTPIISSKKISLKSSNGDVFEVDYAVALMSQTIEHAIKTGPAGDSIPLSRVSSKILAKVIEYCKKHSEASSYKEHTSDVDLKDWDSDFVEVDQETLFDLILSANYLDIKSLLDLTTDKAADMIKGKTPEEIRKTLKIENSFTPEEEEEIRREDQWAFE